MQLAGFTTMFDGRFQMKHYAPQEGGRTQSAAARHLPMSAVREAALNASQDTGTLPFL